MNIKELTGQILDKIYGYAQLSSDTTREGVESILTQYLTELIGEDQGDEESFDESNHYLYGRNSLRKELRTQSGLTPPQEGE